MSRSSLTSARLPLIRETSSDAVGSSAAGTAQTRQHSLPRGGRLLVRASGSQRVCWRTYDRRAELAVWSCRVRRSVAARAASFSRRPGDRVTPLPVTASRLLLPAGSATRRWALRPSLRRLQIPSRQLAQSRRPRPIRATTSTPSRHQGARLWRMAGELVAWAGGSALPIRRVRPGEGLPADPELVE